MSDTEVAEVDEPTSPGAFGRSEMFAEVKRHLLQVVKDEVKQEAFGFSEIPHKQTVRVYLKEVRELVSKCSQMEGSTKLASIETAMSAALDILGVALREGQTMAEEIKMMRAKRASFTAEAAKELATRETERLLEKLRRQAKKEEVKAKELTDKCETFTAELRDERIEVRSLTLKLQDFKVRAKERVDRGEEELRSAEARHSRELEKLRRKMRQEKQDEIGQMMEKVTDDLKRESDVARQRSAQSSETFWKTRFESLEVEHRAEGGRSAALQTDLAAARKESALLTAREREARDALMKMTAEAERSATSAAVGAMASKAELQDLHKQVHDLDKKLAKEKKRLSKAKSELAKSEDKLGTAKEDVLRGFRDEKRSLETKTDTATQQCASYKIAVDGLKAQLCKSVEEVASEKERHKKSKTKFSKSFSEAKATQDNLREQIASLTNARTKDGDTTASLSGKIIQLNGTIKELQGKLMLSEDSVAAVEADLQTEKHRASLVRNELSELQFSQLQQEATGGRKLYEANRKLRQLEGVVQTLKTVTPVDDGPALLAEVDDFVEPPPLSHVTDDESYGGTAADGPPPIDDSDEDVAVPVSIDGDSDGRRPHPNSRHTDTDSDNDGPPPIEDAPESDDDASGPPAISMWAAPSTALTNDSDIEDDKPTPTPVPDANEDDFGEDELSELEAMLDSNMAKMATVLGDGTRKSTGSSPQINSAEDIDRYLDTLLGSVKGDGVAGSNGTPKHSPRPTAALRSTNPAPGPTTRQKPLLPHSPKPVLKSAQRAKMKASPKPVPKAKPAPKAVSKPALNPATKIKPGSKAKPTKQQIASLFDDDSDDDDAFLN